MEQASLISIATQLLVALVRYQREQDHKLQLLEEAGLFWDHGTFSYVVLDLIVDWFGLAPDNSGTEPPDISIEEHRRLYNEGLLFCRDYWADSFHKIIAGDAEHDEASCIALAKEMREEGQGHGGGLDNARN